jgi:hypothetical protein
MAVRLSALRISRTLLPRNIIILMFLVLSTGLHYSRVLQMSVDSRNLHLYTLIMRLIPAKQHVAPLAALCVVQRLGRI